MLQWVLSVSLWYGVIYLPSAFVIVFFNFIYIELLVLSRHLSTIVLHKELMDNGRINDSICFKCTNTSLSTNKPFLCRNWWNKFVKWWVMGFPQKVFIFWKWVYINSTCYFIWNNQWYRWYLNEPVMKTSFAIISKCSRCKKKEFGLGLFLTMPNAQSRFLFFIYINLWKIQSERSHKSKLNNS